MRPSAKMGVDVPRGNVTPELPVLGFLAEDPSYSIHIERLLMFISVEKGPVPVICCAVRRRDFFPSAENA
jgi:hypothetical protein